MGSLRRALQHQLRCHLRAGTWARLQTVIDNAEEDETEESADEGAEGDEDEEEQGLEGAEHGEWQPDDPLLQSRRPWSASDLAAITAVLAHEQQQQQQQQPADLAAGSDSGARSVVTVPSTGATCPHDRPSVALAGGGVPTRRRNVLSLRVEQTTTRD